LALGFDFGGRVRPVNVVMSTLFELVATMAIGAVLARKDMLQRCAGLLAGLWRAGKEFLSMPSYPVYVLNGGLGNQLFILAAAMAESKERGTSVYLDVSAFSGKSLRELELSKFKLPNNIRILRRRALYGRYYDSFIQRLWNVILQFASKGKGLRIGYFQDKKYPEGLKSEILSLLRSAPVSDYWLSQISDQVKCVCHVRAGDYLLKQNQEFHGLLSRDYFIRGWQIISSSDGGNPPSSVGVICDSAAYLESLGLTFKHYSLEQDRALTAIEILAIMSRTPHLILSNSSLSWWGAFWADLEGVAANVVAPKDWYVDAEAGDIYLKSWHIVESKLNESDNP
jgi:hypothetical protein